MIWWYILLPIQIISIILTFLMGVLWIFARQDERKHIREGYWIEHLSPGQLRGDEDHFAVVYHELERQQFFYGKSTSHNGVDQLLLPDEATWRAQMPDWLKAKRMLVLERIQKSTKHIEIVTDL